MAIGKQANEEQNNKGFAKRRVERTSKEVLQWKQPCKPQQEPQTKTDKDKKKHKPP